MDTMSAFAMGMANRGRESRVFDWDKAALLLRERGVQSAEAGLSGDMGWTGGVILRDGKPLDRSETYTYLASTWAIPIIVIDGEEIECWRMESATPEWDSDTYWPDSARAIFAGD